MRRSPNGALESFVTNEEQRVQLHDSGRLALPTSMPGDVLDLVRPHADGSPLPDWLFFNPVTRTLSGTPATATSACSAPSSRRDGPGRRVDREMFILINDVNDAPVIARRWRLAVDGSRTFSFTVPADTFVDDSGGVSLTAQMADGTALAVMAHLRSADAHVLGNAGSHSVGESEGVHVYRVAVTATDTDGRATTTILERRGARAEPGHARSSAPRADDSFTGTLGPDTIYGLGGNDTIAGREGTDTYDVRSRLRPRHDTRALPRSSSETASIDDIISFGAGITPSDVTVTFAESRTPAIYFNSVDPTIISGFSKYDLILTVAGTGDTVRIRNAADQRAVRIRLIGGGGPVRGRHGVERRRPDRPGHDRRGRQRSAVGDYSGQRPHRRRRQRPAYWRRTATTR